MANLDDEIDLDALDVTKALLGDTPKKKPRAKSKKAKDSTATKSPSKTAKVVIQVPLSMQEASADDLTLYNYHVGSVKNLKSTAVDYDAQKRYTVAQIISHKIFGYGYVAALSGHNKMEVVFKTGRKLLITAPAA